MRRLGRVGVAGDLRSFRAWRSGLSRRSNYSCALGRRCASIRRAGRRSTTGPVRASSARRRWLRRVGAPFRSSPVVRISKIATTATTAPATGVHNPAMRRSAASASDAEATMCNGEPLDSPEPACQSTTAPTTSRISNKAIPGEPPANVEYRRRNTYLDTIIRRGDATRPPPTGPLA